MFGNGAINFSEDVLTASAKALAIMVERFVPQNNSCLYSARNIGEILQGLQFGMCRYRLVKIGADEPIFSDSTL